MVEVAGLALAGQVVEDHTLGGVAGASARNDLESREATGAVLVEVAG